MHRFASRLTSHWTSRLACLLGCVIACSLPAQAGAQRYVLSLLPPVAGGFDSAAVAINDQGHVAGSSGFGEAGPAVATHWQRGVPKALPTLGGTGSGWVQAIDAKGRMVGDSTTADGDSHATLWKAGRAVDLGTLGGRFSTALALNARGVVVGFSNFDPDDPNNSHATRWHGTRATDLGTLGGTFSGAYALNNLDQIVGVSATAGNHSVNAVRWAEGGMTDLGPGYAYGINDAGDIVGSNGQLATRWQGDVPLTLPTLGGTLSLAAGLNNAGQIVGWSMLAGDGVTHAVLWQDGTALDLDRFVDATSRAAGWYLSSASAINAPGWIVGTASNTLTGAHWGYLLRPRGGATASP